MSLQKHSVSLQRNTMYLLSGVLMLDDVALRETSDIYETVYKEL